MINGIINVYKEKGYTSFDVVARLRGVYHQKKIGHTGTLDPDAEGVLPVCLGKATRVCDLLTDKDKEYEAVLLLGVQTDTQDMSGTVLASAPVLVTEEEAAAAILSFVGEYDQIPPMYSALKVNGQKLCDLARKGVTVERKARRIQIYGIEILEMNLPEVKIRVACSKGTYIRTLCQDIGEKLGCGGCMKSLLRTKVSDFLIGDAHRISEIEKQPEEWVLPVDFVFTDYKKACVSDGADKLIRNGNRIPEELISDFCDGHRTGTIRLYDSGQNFIGLYAYQPDAKDFKPVKLFME
jgi:tRNA pseudouridine55 synthase